MKDGVSIIIVSYNTGEVLWETLKYALSQKDLTEIIFVNNGNPEEVLSRLNKIASENSKVRIITGHGNVGFGKGCNIGASYARNEYILILNPDCLLTEPETFSGIISEMNKHPDVWTAGCRMFLPDGSLQKTNMRNILTPEILFCEGFLLHKIFKSKSLNIPENINDKSPKFVPAISGAFMFFRSDKYKELGGFDEGYFLHVEDIDICLEIKKRGGKILYLPHISVCHHKSSSEVSSKFVEYHKKNGFIRYFSKNCGKIFTPSLYPFIVIAVYLNYYRKIIKFRLIRKTHN